MARSIDPTLRSYLQHRIREWLAVDGHKAKDLARLAGVSGAQISDALNKGSIGWQTMIGLLPVFGLTLATMEDAAKAWAEAHPGDAPAPASSRRPGPQRLRDRPEWARVMGAVLHEHAELDSEDVAAVGRLGDEREVFVGPLDVPTVAGLAAVLAARRLRLARRKPTP